MDYCLGVLFFNHTVFFFICYLYVFELTYLVENIVGKQLKKFLVYVTFERYTFTIHVVICLWGVYEQP